MKTRQIIGEKTCIKTMPSDYLHAETKAASKKLPQNMKNLNGTQKGQSRGGVSSAYHRED